MSTVKTDAIETRAGGTSVLTIGTATQTIKLPGGTPGADKVLTSNATGEASWAAAAAGGITHASQWRLTTGFANSIDPIATNVEAVIAADPTTTTASPTSSTALGAPMDLTSGRFTFPTTGYWWVEFICTYDSDTYNQYPSGGLIKFTTNDSTYTLVTGENGMSYLGYYHHSYGNVLLDITDTANQKVSFQFLARGATDRCEGNAAFNQTVMSFTRWGDT